MKRLAILLIEAYRNTLSTIKIGSCRFYPSCSEYTQEAIKKYGFLRGSVFGIKRVLRCNQFFNGGYDPLP